MKRIRALIIDDEAHCHKLLKSHLLVGHEYVDILGQGYSVKEGLELVAQHKPELVFLDVEMPGGTGFDLLQQVGKPSFYVVFITAYNKYAEAAFLFGALDFMTKPVLEDRLRETMERASSRIQEKYTLEQLQITLDAYQGGATAKHPPSRICVPTSDGFELVEVERIVHLDADRNITEFHILDRKKKLLACKALKDYEKHFALHPGFGRIMKRVHRSHIANLLMVDKWVKGDSYLLMRDGCKVPVSDTNRDDVVGWLGEL